MSGCQPVNTLIEKGLKLCVESNQVSTDKGRYQRLVGKLIVLSSYKTRYCLCIECSESIHA